MYLNNLNRQIKRVLRVWPGGRGQGANSCLFRVQCLSVRDQAPPWLSHIFDSNRQTVRLSIVESVGDAHLVQMVVRVEVDGMRGFWDGCGTELLVLLLFTLYRTNKIWSWRYKRWLKRAVNYPLSPPIAQNLKTQLGGNYNTHVSRFDKKVRRIRLRWPSVRLPVGDERWMVGAGLGRHPMVKQPGVHCTLVLWVLD